MCPQYRQRQTSALNEQGKTIFRYAAKALVRNPDVS